MDFNDILSLFLLVLVSCLPITLAIPRDVMVEFLLANQKAHYNPLRLCFTLTPFMTIPEVSHTYLIGFPGG